MSEESRVLLSPQMIRMMCFPLWPENLYYYLLVSRRLSTGLQSVNLLNNITQSSFEISTTTVMPTAVVTGANSGIGHAFAHVLIKEVIQPCPTKDSSLNRDIQGYKVHACDREVGNPIKSLSQDQTTIHKLDVTSPESIAAFQKAVEDEPIDLLLNVAGRPPYSSLSTPHRIR